MGGDWELLFRSADWKGNRGSDGQRRPWAPLPQRPPRGLRKAGWHFCSENKGSRVQGGAVPSELWPVRKGPGCAALCRARSPDPPGCWDWALAVGRSLSACSRSPGLGLGEWSEGKMLNSSFSRHYCSLSPRPPWAPAPPPPRPHYQERASCL